MFHRKMRKDEAEKWRECINENRSNCGSSYCNGRGWHLVPVVGTSRSRPKPCPLVQARKVLGINLKEE